ncbi:hypothetical protein ASPWEDRAFT_24229 [Aspergillus wentii DTO 134E9]|uniref:Uncharacterized protein n=1 Tax=Aspergillus wentii DTO 134E9 TaxID=1073089 RepID=A0A1L9RTU2_ASPWE|nr:uncharacterized protein ASPWEDRAFT_24229 [Aspergillus wentii DTO 134E9]OJJ38278.1 hypothetical protein ASPWEDRAFT_24229 [Aspergillus wentii DTO 134E9]
MSGIIPIYTFSVKDRSSGEMIESINRLRIGEKSSKSSSPTNLSGFRTTKPFWLKRQVTIQSVVSDSFQYTLTFDPRIQNVFRQNSNGLDGGHVLAIVEVKARVFKPNPNKFDEEYTCFTVFSPCLRRHTSVQCKYIASEKRRSAPIKQLGIWKKQDLMQITQMREEKRQPIYENRNFLIGRNPKSKTLITRSKRGNGKDFCGKGHAIAAKNPRDGGSRNEQSGNG